MGGTIAFEAAQQLGDTGERVAMLALLDTMNWHKVPLTIWSKSSHAIQKVLFHAAGFLHLDRLGKKCFSRRSWKLCADAFQFGLVRYALHL